jgi:hypothetical protein
MHIFVFLLHNGCHLLTKFRDTILHIHVSSLDEKHIVDTQTWHLADHADRLV